jgi:pyrophosphatase PpaX
MIKTVLFDLDGTIVDTNELILSTYLHVLAGQPGEPWTRERLIPHMGAPLIEQMMMFTGQSDVEAFIRTYREYNLRMHDELVREFPHVKEVMEALRRNGIRMGVVTSKIRRTTEMGLNLCKLREYIDVIVSVDEVLKPKPDPEGILKAMRELGAEPETTVMVGDSSYDIEAAKNAGVRSAGVAWSLKGEAFMRGLEPDYLLQDMRDLLEVAGLTREVP